MIRWLIDTWDAFVGWIDTLGSREAAVLGAVGLVVLTGLGKHIVLPLLRWAGRGAKNLLDPLLSGAVLFDRFWAQPRYLEKTEAALERVRNPWLPEGKRLRELFIPVHVHTSGASGEQQRDLREALVRYPSAIVVGGPGSGKTTGLRALGLAEIQAFRTKEPGHARLPVFVNLRSLGESGLPFAEYLAGHFREHGFPRPERFLRKQLARGRLLFLFDGLDEVDAERLDRVLGILRRLIEDHVNVALDQCRVYISSRPGSYDGQLHDLLGKTLYMADFSPRQIRDFVFGFDFRPPKSAGYLLGVVMDRPPILDICRNPLMLTIATYLYRETDYQLPESREEFYKTCVDALLRRWDAAKELDQRNRYPAALKQAFLEQVATTALDSRRLDLSMEHLYRSAEGFLGGRRGTYEVAPFVEEIIRSGLLVRLPTGEAFFAHKTLAESLTATYLRNQPDELVARWEKDPTAWLEVASLYVADPRAHESDIALLLDAAVRAGAMEAEIILAGEAHSCPARQKADLLARVAARPSGWEPLPRRAFASLGRLGEDARELLLRMLRDGTPVVKQGVVYALGHVGGHWATPLIIDALNDATTRPAAVDALASLGDRALGVVREASAEMPPQEVLVSLVQVLEKIGSRDALKLLIPFVTHEDLAVRSAATWAALGHMTDGERSTDFSAAAAETELVITGETLDIVRWAFPFHRDLPLTARGVYAHLVANLAAELGGTARLKQPPLRFQRLSPLISGPVAIQGRRLDLLRDRFTSGPYRNDFRSPGSRLEHRLPVSEAKAFWSRLADSSPREFVVDGERFALSAVLSAAVVFLPIGKVVVAGVVDSGWLGYALALLAVAAAIVTALVVERGSDLKIAPVCAYFGLFPAVLRAEVHDRRGDPPAAMLLALAGISVLPALMVVLGWVVAFRHLPPAFLACMLPWLAALPFYFRPVSYGEGEQLKFTMGENPFWHLVPRDRSGRVRAEAVPGSRLRRETGGAGLA